MVMYSYLALRQGGGCLAARHRRAGLGRSDGVGVPCRAMRTGTSTSRGALPLGAMRTAVAR